MPPYFSNFSPVRAFCRGEYSEFRFFRLDSLRSTKYLLFNHDNYERVVKGAVSFGNDTDTTAAIAGGLAGIAFGGIPERWLSALRDKVYVDALIQNLFSQE